MASGQEQDKKEQANGLPVIVRRKLQNSGGSTVVTVPIEWLKQYALKEGDNVLVIANGSLKIIPDDKEIIKRLHEAIGEVKTE